jgi:hypothetical protein
MKRPLFWAGVGAFAMYFFDPQLGRTRLADVRRRSGSLIGASALRWI